MLSAQYNYVNLKVVCFLTEMIREVQYCMLKITDGREKRPWVFRALPFIPSAFSPAFSSCSLTTSFMCCHWGSPSPISWTLTSPSGLLPVLYLVILILTWSSAAWSGVTRQKRDKQHSWPQNQSAGPQDGRGESQESKTLSVCITRCHSSITDCVTGFSNFSSDFSYWK